MSLQSSDESEIQFHDASAYFSEEEWKLLQEWHKDLYRNVMKEIHQALISLGPLIATTVCSVRAKEKEELHPMMVPYSEKRHGVTHSPNDAVSNLDVCYRTNKKEHQHLNKLQCSEGTKTNDFQSAEFLFLNTDIHLRKEDEPDSLFIDHRGEEIVERSTDPSFRNAITTTVVSFHIKDEKDTCSMDHEDSESLQTNSKSLGKGRVSRKVEGAYAGKTRPCKVDADKDNMAKSLCLEKEIQHNIKIWPEVNKELDESEAAQCKNGFSHPTLSTIHKTTPSVQTSKNYNHIESKQSYAQPFKCQRSMQQTFGTYSSSEVENSFIQEYSTGHKTTQSEVRPYQCTECSKSFSKKANLFVHMRTHTGERPYHCNICDKSFNQRGILTRHQRTHLRERPF